MKDFLLMYEGGSSTWMEGRTPAEIQAVMDEWGAWFKELETSGHLRNPGAALAPGGATLKRNGSAVHTDLSLPEVKELIGGFTIIAAESLEEAAELAKGAPFIRNEAGGTLVVRPIFQPEA